MPTQRSLQYLYDGTDFVQILQTGGRIVASLGVAPQGGWLFEQPFYRSVQDGIVAGDGQASAFQLTAQISRIVAGSVRLPPSAPGLELTVINDTGATLNVFPSAGETIGQLNINEPYEMKPGSPGDPRVVIFISVSKKWYSK